MVQRINETVLYFTRDPPRGPEKVDMISYLLNDLQFPGTLRLLKAARKYYREQILGNTRWNSVLDWIRTVEPLFRGLDLFHYMVGTRPDGHLFNNNEYKQHKPDDSYDYTGSSQNVPKILRVLEGVSSLKADEELKLSRIRQICFYVGMALSRGKSISTAEVKDTRSTSLEVCETGFNAGHCALFWKILPSYIEHPTKLYSFDACDTRKGFRCDVGLIYIQWLLSETAPDRVRGKDWLGRNTDFTPELLLNTHINNFDTHLLRDMSQRSVPAFFDRFGLEKRCDIIHIDGGHQDPVPWIDLANFYEAHISGFQIKNNIAGMALILMDDLCTFQTGPSVSWLRFRGSRMSLAEADGWNEALVKTSSSSAPSATVAEFIKQEWRLGEDMSGESISYTTSDQCVQDISKLCPLGLDFHDEKFQNRYIDLSSANQHEIQKELCIDVGEPIVKRRQTCLAEQGKRFCETTKTHHGIRLDEISIKTNMRQFIRENRLSYIDVDVPSLSCYGRIDEEKDASGCRFAWALI